MKITKVVEKTNGHCHGHCHGHCTGTVWALYGHCRGPTKVTRTPDSTANPNACGHSTHRNRTSATWKNFFPLEVEQQECWVHPLRPLRCFLHSTHVGCYHTLVTYTSARIYKLRCWEIPSPGRWPLR